MTKHTILFLAANPLGTDRLALDEEARAIQEELERSGHRDQFELVTRWAVRPLDLLRALRKLKPTIVHFSGQGGGGRAGEPRQHVDYPRELVDGEGGPDDAPPDALYFQGSGGRPQLVSTAALKETFGAAGSSVKLVVLSACYSEAQADGLLAYVGCVVGMGGAISDDTARSFAIGFYGGLVDGESVAAAFRQGRAAIKLSGILDWKSPQLKVRAGINAQQVFPVEGLAESVTAASDPLGFSVISIDARDSNWCSGAVGMSTDLQMQAFWPFRDEADHYFRTRNGLSNADPILDITLMNMSSSPVVLAAVGIEILQIARLPVFWTTLGVPVAAKILKVDSYEIEVPNVQKYLPAEKHRNPLKTATIMDMAEIACGNLPDPIYLEPGAPYRYSLLLKYYSRHVPGLARIRMFVSTDKGRCYSKEIEMVQ